MSILDIRIGDTRYKYHKTVLVYLCVSILSVVINKVYALFGHGVSSDAMTWMFLYPLLGGGLLYLLLWFLLPGVNCFTGYRLFFNLYNSGIALLSVGSLLKGIMEIAGTSSPYLKLYAWMGCILTGAGVLLLLILAVNYNKLRTQAENPVQ